MGLDFLYNPFKSCKLYSYGARYKAPAVPLKRNERLHDVEAGVASILFSGPELTFPLDFCKFVSREFSYISLDSGRLVSGGCRYKAPAVPLKRNERLHHVEAGVVSISFSGAELAVTLARALDLDSTHQVTHSFKFCGIYSPA